MKREKKNRKLLGVGKVDREEKGDQGKRVKRR